MIMNETKSDIKSYFRRLASAEDFDETGFAKVEPLDAEYNNYLNWLDNGFHSDMHYLNRRLGKRRDITILLEDAKTVIVFLHNYNTVYKHSGQKENGKISRYAWGDDYHNILKEKLTRIASKAKSTFPDNSFKVYVDTGPVLEKQWAVRAGVGWQGKNSMLINRKLGSYTFIGIIITDLVVEANKQQRNYCGSCTACIDNCPTGAIVQPYVVDSRKCISYWTIETKPYVSFPDSVKQNLNGWLFGCDICQEVCPWNAKVHFTRHEYFKPRKGETELNLTSVLKMTENEFRERFRNSPIKRTKLAGLQRNAEALEENNKFL